MQINTFLATHTRFSDLWRRVLDDGAVGSHVATQTAFPHVPSISFTLLSQIR
jgi:hypothetical protein